MAKKHYNATHGMSGTTTYRAWEAMKRRCESPKSTQFKYYGGRGITICKRWMKFELFFADMGQKPDGLTLERNNTNGSYSPENCRWATKQEQAINKRRNIRVSHNGKTLTLMEWEPIVQIPHPTLYQRYKRDGDRPPRLFRPVKKQYNNRKIIADS